MSNHPVIEAISSLINKDHAKNYADSAPMFNAIIETSLKKGRYFIESSQFEELDGSRPFPRQYCLKYISDSNVVKIKEFKSKHYAFKFWENVEFTSEGALVLDRFNCPRTWFDAHITNHYRLNERLYDNGYTAFYSFDLLDRAISYCEGDIVEYHVPGVGCQRKLKDRFLSFYRENVE